MKHVTEVYSFLDDVNLSCFLFFLLLLVHRSLATIQNLKNLKPKRFFIIYLAVRPDLT